uniref:IS701 family transposase n=1 Tax=Leptolyngbya sp. BC1307 TaxID=2029589 RepID=UPI001F0AA16F
LLAEPKYVSCVRLSEILAEVSHDSINRFLLREQYTPKDLFEEVKSSLVLTAGTLSVDDSVEDKPYRDHNKSAFVDFFWSGKHKRSVKGINLITLYYTDTSGSSYPVNFRIYDKQEGKTKNDYFREMVLEVVSWGLEPSWVTGDSWYSSLENLKFLRDQKVGFLFGIANNRKVSIERGTSVLVKTIEIPSEGLMVYLKAFGWVRVFCQPFKNEPRYYILYRPDLEMLQQLTRETFKSVHDDHWKIECFHRVIKQVCNIERFYVRGEQAIRNHFFCALRAFCKLQTLCINGLINNCYEISRQLFVPVIRQFILENVTEATFA